MSVLILNHAEVTELLPMTECITVMEEALSALARGEVEQPLRRILKPTGVRGVIATMPTFRGGERPLFGLKAICVFPGNAAQGMDAHQGGVLLYSGETGEVLSMVNASAITAIRTAAVSALATRTLARPDAHELAIIGAGVQARSHLEALAVVRTFTRARVAARRLESAQAFAGEMQSRCDFPIEAVATAEAAVRDADVIVTVTTSREPVVQRDWVMPGAHINAVGTFSPSAREVDTATMTAATLFVDRRESALNEAGDYLLAAKEGALSPEDIRAELGEVLTGKDPGRTSRDEITLFKSLGLAIEDLAAAEHVYRKALQQSKGTQVDFS